MSACVFCEIATGQAPANVIEEWPDAIAFTPLKPVVDGHVLVAPKAHVRDFQQDPVVTAAVFARVAELASQPADEDGLNLITSAGSAATQTVFHMHVHMIPRYVGDAVSLPWDVRSGAPIGGEE